MQVGMNKFGFSFDKKIGSGSFGQIFLGTNKQTGQEVAIKLEIVTIKHPQLLFEGKLYKVLQGGVGIPQAYWFGSENEYNILVMELLGSNLEDLFNQCKRKFSLKTVLMIAQQMITRIEFLHSKNFIHRDIKPDNFLIGIDKRVDTIYVIDFGLSKKFRDTRTNLHIPYRDGKSLTGTARYASINTHLGVEQSRRDDLEAIGYVLVYFLNGQLPWQGLKTDNQKDKYEKITESKIGTTVEKLCEGMPEEFSIYLNYCKSLKFEERPDYVWLRKLFKDLYGRMKYPNDNLFDWSTPLL
ncbi:unnamed protein product [Paramecium pentaurelia]|uniref:Casein kinase I n=1 Tax=Paramecium pentaurelia TaxID=43138 RepID=A0A8S1UI10_9CILI|nr:unnamed protein product [Paramecium pentaurelia]